MPDFIYVDACVILAFLSEEPVRVDVVDACLQDAVQGKLGATLVTSTLSIAEVAWVEQLSDGRRLSTNDIETFWNDGPIRLVEVSEVHAIAARELVHRRASRPPIHPDFNGRRHAADAIHLATALTISATAFWTYNIRDFRNFDANGIFVTEPVGFQPRMPGV